MQTVNNKSYIKRLSDYTFPITTYNKHTFNKRSYFFDRIDKRFYVKCSKWIDGECYNYQKLNLRFDTREYPYVELYNDFGRSVHVYIERLFREVFGTDDFEVKL